MRNVQDKFRRQHESHRFSHEENSCNGVDNISIIVHKKKVKNRVLYDLFKNGHQPAVAIRLSCSGMHKTRKLPTKHHSLPHINKKTKMSKNHIKSSDAILKKKNYFNTKFIVNRVSGYHFDEYLSPFNFPIQRRWKVYRCQLSSQEESCCCSCNSDAMFEVMKSLYDCYKKKNCDDCNCILCGHLLREERRLGEIKKSIASLGIAAKERKSKIKKAEKALRGKTTAEKENILKELAKTGEPLPEGKTASEKALIQKVRLDVGLPPEPKTASEKAKMRKAEEAGVMTPLEGKTASQKEKILKAQTQLGIALPEGRTESEKALIQKVKTAAGIPILKEQMASDKAITAKIKAKTRAPSEVPTPSEKMRKAKAAGLLTPLEGKTPEQKEKILRGLAKQGIPLPEGKTASERKLIDKVRADLVLPPEPKTPSMREKYIKAADAGLLQPLEGKSHKEKEKILQGLQDMGIPLPEGRTSSEKALIAKVKAAPHATPLPEEKAPRAPSVLAPSEKLRKAKAAGLLTPLAGKSPAQREKILRGLAMIGVPLPEGQTPSEKVLIDKVRTDLGLPPEPKTPSMKEKYAKAAKSGLLQPLEGKSVKEKEKILQGLQNAGIPLPEGRTASEKALIAKVKAAGITSVTAPSEKMLKAKAAGLLTPLEGKTPSQKEKIIKGLAMQGLPLPEGKTESERKLVEKVRAEVGKTPAPKMAVPVGPPALPPEQRRKLDEKTAKVVKEGKGPVDECICGLLTPEHEREPVIAIRIPSGKARPSKAGLLTPLEGKTPEQKEKILRGLVKHGIPLPEAKTASEQKLIDKIRADVRLPPEPKTPSMKEKYKRAQASGVITPLEGKTTAQKEKILKRQAELGIPLPEGRTKSEKALIAKIKTIPSPSITTDKLRKAKAAGLLTPLEGKSPEQKEKILRGLVKHGIPLPEAKTASEQKLIDKIRADVRLPPEPKTPSMKEKYKRAQASGVITPLEGKTTAQKEKILKRQAELGIPLPEGRTESEKALIAKIKTIPSPSITTDKLRKAKAAGLLTPLEGKSPEQKEKILRGLVKHGIPLPEAKTASEQKLIDKIRADVRLPPEPKTPSMKEKYKRAQASGVITPLEGKTTAQKEKILKRQAELGIPLPEGRTESEKALIAKIKTIPSPSITTEKLRKAKAAGLLTPLEGKSPEQKEKILRGLVKHGIPLPEAKTASEQKLIDKIRADVRLPPEPKTLSMKEKYKRAQASGVITPLEGKTTAQKEKILKRQAELGIPLPEGRTESEKALIAKIKTIPSPSITTDKLRKAKAAGLLTPLEGKSPEQKEKILRGLAKSGLPLPEGRTASDKAMVKKIKTELGIPERTPSEKLRKAKTAGLLTPLEGKTKSQKEKILRGRAVAGLPLPEGKTPSEKDLIKKIKEDTGYVTPSPSEKVKKAKAAGLLTPLEGKTRSAKEKILRERVAVGVPIGEGKTPSEKELIKEIIAKEPPTVKRPSEKLRQAKAAGALTPLEGKTKEQKEKIIRGLVKAGLPIPEAKTTSEKSLMDRIRQEVGLPPEPKTPSMKVKYKKAQEAGIVTPLEGKSKAEKEKILKKLHEGGIPLPEGRTPSEKSIIKRIKAGLPARKISSEKIRAAKAAGLLTPLEGKTPSQKEKIVRGLAKSGMPLPEGKTASEKELIAKVKAETKQPTKITSEKFRKAKAAGLLTPLTGKSPKEKERILKGLIEQGLPLPEAQTASEKKIATKIRQELGLPPEPTTLSEKEKMRKAQATGIVTPLEGKTASQKERILRGMAEAGIKLPEGRTASEKEMIKKIQAGKPKPIAGPPALPPEKRAKLDEKTAKVMKEGKGPSDECICGLLTPESEREEPKTVSEKAKAKAKAEEKALPSKIPSEKIRKAKAAGLLTPLEGKTAKEKEKVMRGLAKQGLPLPDAKTASERKIADKIRKELGLPPEPKTASMKEKYEKASAAGVLVPLEGLSPAEKEKVLRGQAELGLALPEGRTASEKALITKVKSEQPPSKVTSEKLRQAKAAGLLTPLEGKTEAQKEKIVKKLAEAGLPLPEGKTASEKALIDKVRTELGIPPTKRSTKTKSRKIGVTPSKKLARTMAKGTTGISEEFEDIIKTTTCDRGCGCDKKKIRFKHSYVKIRVTSPDISSLCPCPNECIPGVKAGAFIDNEGIKVTVGRVDGVTSYTNQLSNHILEMPNNIVTLFNKIQTNSCSSNTSTDTIDAHIESTVETNILKKCLYETCPSLRYTNYDDKLESDNDTVTSETCDSQNNYKTYKIESDKKYAYERTPQYEKCTVVDESYRCLDISAESSRDVFQTSDPTSSSIESIIIGSSSGGSFKSALVIKRESSLSLSTNSSASMDATSAISVSQSSNSTASSHYLYCVASDGHNSESPGEETERFTNEMDCFGNDSSNDTETGNTEVSVSHFDRTHSKNKEHGTILSLGDRNQYLTYRMSHSQHHTEDKMHRNTRNINNHEPVIVINHLDSEHDITTMVDQLLSNNEFSDASSIFLFVPTSDDNDSDISSDSLSSTLCIQLSEHYGNYYHKHLSQLQQEPDACCHLRNQEITHRRDSCRNHGVRISTKGKKFCLEGMEEAAVSCHDKETMFNYKLPFYSKQKREENQQTKNKLCQMTTPNEILQRIYHAVSTDTTSDRPCCCPQTKSVRHQNRNSEHRCVANVMSEVITPLLVNEGLSSEGHRWSPKLNVAQQVSFVSVHRGLTSVVPCEIPPCTGRFECHSPHDVHGVPGSPDFSPKPCSSSKPTPGMKQSQPCQCNPEQLKQLLEQAMNVKKTLNMKSTGCGGQAAGNVTELREVLEKGEECGSCAQPKHKDGLSMECTCSGKKKKVKLGPLCPCEQHQPPISQAITGPKSGTRSLGCQCCVCENSALKTGAKMGIVCVLGPAGGICKVEPGGTYTQAGMEQEQNEKPRKECPCKNKKGKKKNNVICECPPAEPELEDLELLFQQYASYQWSNEKEVMRQKSDMTQTQSGFKMFKTKKPPSPPQVELTMEDAVRYYVTMNPDLLRDLVPPPQEEDCSCEEDKKSKKKKGKTVDCSCSYEPPPPEPEPAPPEGPSGGLKFSIFGKGSGSKGLSGVCCFDMMQETRDTMQKTWISKPN